jgi:ABC-2 type transport system permease protein
MALIGWTPRASTMSWALLGICFVIGMFGQVLGLPQWVQDVSPFQHTRYPAGAFEVLPLLVLGVVAAALTAFGLGGLRRRDIA